MMLDDPWTRFASEHGLTPDPEDPRTWVGAVEGVPVRLEVVPTGPASRRVRVAFPLDRPGLVLVAPAHALAAGGRVTTGDEELDHAALLWVHDPIDLGCFAAPVRSLAAELIARGVHVVQGAVRIEPWAGLADPEVADVLARAAELARALSIPRGDAIRSFSAIASQDPDPEVRAAYEGHARGSDALASALAAAIVARPGATADTATLEVLVRQLGTSAGAKAKHAAMVKVLSMYPLAECAPVVRRFAAVADTRALVLRALLRHIVKPGLDVGAWLELLGACVPGLPIAVDVVEAIARACAGLRHPAAAPILVHLAATADPRATAAGLRALVSLPLSADDLYDALPPNLRERVALAGPDLFGDDLAPAIGLVARCYRQHHASYLPLEVRRATLAALGEHGGTDDQDLLVAGLDIGDDELRLTALAGLARLGDGRALAAIRPHASGFFRSARIKTAAREALDAIQDRVGEAGGLALSDGGEAGALSLPPDETRG